MVIAINYTSLAGGHGYAHFSKGPFSNKLLKLKLGDIDVLAGSVDCCFGGRTSHYTIFARPNKSKDNEKAKELYC